MNKNFKVIFSCEHGGNLIPQSFCTNVQIPFKIKNSHQAYDKGALQLAHFLKSHFKKPLVENNITRLLLDFNRSPQNTKRWGVFSKSLHPKDKDFLSQKYQSYVKSLQDFIQKYHSSHTVLHFSIHSFTPVFKNKVRKTQIGLLFDPTRKQEKWVCEQMKQDFAQSFCVHLNRPYRGTSDGLTTLLRKKFKSGYVGIEIEINQKLVQNKSFEMIKRVLKQSLKNILE